MKNYFQLMHKIFVWSYSSLKFFGLIFPFMWIYFGVYLNNIKFNQYNAFRDTSDCFRLIYIAGNGPLVYSSSLYSPATSPMITLHLQKRTHPPGLGTTPLGPPKNMTIPFIMENSLRAKVHIILNTFPVNLNWQNYKQPHLAFHPFINS
ncbi:hypothetical protein VP01_3092g2 [Puccinia sorghi]|uniref:Uncharacterized protein n=1 Tax=Puccinia sorghi TaxID=27349 RepID=A0A0L6UZJ4_9BASI|nr:hypothetical protein VP01_3092g2 [Puccinia sorghi]